MEMNAKSIMNMRSAIAALSALAHESRLMIFRALVQAGEAGLPAGKISEMLQIAPSSLSFHLKELAYADLVTATQQGRFVIYVANYPTMNCLLAYLTENCCAGVSCVSATSTCHSQTENRVPIMSHKHIAPKTTNILVLCTGNSARSIMSEALINVLGEGRFCAYSAGSQPSGQVNIFAAEQAQSIGYPMENVRSKSWDEFSQLESPHMDIVITVCDSAAGESCPLWRGTPIKIHWNFEDPSHVSGTDEEKRQAFAHTFALIRYKIQQLVNLPMEMLSQEALIKALNQIGESGA